MKSLSYVQLCNPMDYIAHQSPSFMEFSRQEYWSGLPFPFPRDIPNSGIEPRSPALRADTLPSEPPGKPDPLSMGFFPGKNTGVGCHFLLQGIFPTLGSNPGLPHCGQTLYRLSHQGNKVKLCQSHTQLVMAKPGFKPGLLELEAHTLHGVAGPPG